MSAAAPGDPEAQAGGPSGPAHEAGTDHAAPAPEATGPEAEAEERRTVKEAIAPGAAETDQASGGDQAGGDIDLAEALAQRDEYLDSLQRLKAEFDNYRKRVLRDQTDQRERASQQVVEALLGAFDAFDLAGAHHPEVVGPLYAALRAPLARQGLERLEPTGLPFDPTEHEAVTHEPGDEDDKAVVVEVLRPGYRWKGRLLRPAMVRVRG